MCDLFIGQTSCALILNASIQPLGFFLKKKNENALVVLHGTGNLVAG